MQDAWRTHRGSLALGAAVMLMVGTLVAIILIWRSAFAPYSDPVLPVRASEYKALLHYKYLALYRPQDAHATETTLDDPEPSPDELPPDLTPDERASIVRGLAPLLSRSISGASSVQIVGRDLTLVRIHPVTLDERGEAATGTIELIDDTEPSESVRSTFVIEGGKMRLASLREFDPPPGDKP